MGHTPGPWFILEVRGQRFVAAKAPKGHPYFGVSRNVDIAGDEDYPTKEADLQLISAAPNMLAALEACESLIEFYAEREMNAPANNQEAVRDTREKLAQYKAAIQKAKGVSNAQP